MMSRKARIWTFGCPHTLVDQAAGKNPLKRAIQDAEDFTYHAAFALGDLMHGKPLATDTEGPLFYQSVDAFATGHWREHFYPVKGNHDRLAGPEPGASAWFDKWLDPLGENPETSGIKSDYRPFPIIDQTFGAYEVLIGENVHVFVIHDTARPLTPGRSNADGDPGGVIQPETYEWVKAKMLAYKGTGRVVGVATHYGMYESTAGTGHYEGGKLINGVYEGRRHGPGAHNGKYSSYLAFVGEDPSEPPFVQFFADNPGVCHFWWHAHGHIFSGRKIGGKKLIEEKFGCIFMNVGALTESHHGRDNDVNPKSRFTDFLSGAREIVVHAYMHKTVSKYGRTYYRGLHSSRVFTLPETVWL